MGGLAGCATPALEAGRFHYYAGHLDRAERALTEGRVYPKDRALLLMERGTVRQAAGDYEGSVRDWIAAAEHLERLETYSLSKGAASWVVNDGVQDFRGAPYERTLLHAMTALSHFARGDWESAAVEARRIIRSLDPDRRNGYPEDAFSRYVAGFALEMLDDPSNAALQYRLANALLKKVEIDEQTGALRPKAAPPEPPAGSEAPAPGEGAALSSPWPHQRPEHELVCFLLLGRAPGRHAPWEASMRDEAAAPYAEIYHQGQLLGRSYPLADTLWLAYETARIEAAYQAAKTVGRVVAKEALAQSVERQTNEAVGDLLRILLIGILEHPDVRRWETLPRWFQVARVPCPPDVSEIEVRMRSSAGAPLRTLRVASPFAQRGRTTVTFCRDLPVRPAPPLASGALPASAPAQ